MKQFLILTILLATLLPACRSSKNIHLLSKEEFTMPNAFTPNGDGINDKVCFVTPKQATKGKIQVFTRWGIVLWETKNLNDCWDGIDPKTKTPAPTDTYIVKVTQNEINVFEGSLNLLR